MGLPAKYHRYAVDGTAFCKRALHPKELVAMNAMAALAANGTPNARACVDAFWKMNVRTGKRRYYDNCLYFFSLLALSGNYRIW